MSKIIQGKFKILGNKQVGDDYYRMSIAAAPIAQRAKPGQFVHLRISDEVVPLLRRPFSFHRLRAATFEILYQLIGQGTKLLANKQKSDTIDVLGPLGNGFDIKEVHPLDAPAVLILAGGMGIAPLLALVETLVAKGHTPEGIILLLGARNRKQILCIEDFKKIGVRIYVSTDDGTRGHKGVVTDLLKKVLSSAPEREHLGINRIGFKKSSIYACGPRPMLKAVAKIAKEFEIKAHGSLEENMACGVGACLGCAVETKSGYQRVCKEGPVFNLQEINWKVKRG